MSGITTHVLDTALGKPAAGIPVQLERLDEGVWIEIAASTTDADGRCRDLTAQKPEGTYRLRFRTGEYFRGQDRTTIFPEIVVTFQANGEAHYHLPLLLCDNSYTTYRGS